MDNSDRTEVALGCSFQIYLSMVWETTTITYSHLQHALSLTSKQCIICTEHLERTTLLLLCSKQVTQLLTLLAGKGFADHHRF